MGARTRAPGTWRALPVAMVGGGVLWGIWVLLWRSTSPAVLLSGLWCPLLLGAAARWKGVGLRLKPGVWYRVDLWLLFLGLLLATVVRGVIRTGIAIISGRVDPGIVAVPLRVESDLSRLLLVISITASPGTIALLAEGEILYVHCLHLPPRPKLPAAEALQAVLVRLAG